MRGVSRIRCAEIRALAKYDATAIGLSNEILNSRTAPPSVKADGSWEIVSSLPIDAFSQAKIAATSAELKQEHNTVAGLIPA